MTREEMEELKGLAASMGLYDDKNPCKRALILGKAIKALEQEPSRDMEEIEEVMNCDVDAEIKLKMISNILTAKPHHFKALEQKPVFYPQEKPVIVKTTTSTNNTSGKFFDEKTGGYVYPTDTILETPNTATSMPCENSISRQDAVNAFCKTCEDKECPCDTYRILNHLPKVTPKQTEITLESAIDYLHRIGWMQKHDKAMTEGVGVLDKIREEIQENINYNKKMNYQGIISGLLLTLDIIDKYKAGSDPQESEKV